MISRVLCIIDYNPYYQANASANRWRTIAEGLQKRGVDIRGFITGGVKNISELRKCGNSVTINGICFYYSSFLLNNNVWIRRLNKYIFSRFIKKRQSRKLISLIEDMKPEIVWVSSSEQAIDIFCKTYKPLMYKFRVLYEVNEYPDIFFCPGTRSHDLFFNNFLGKVDLLVCMTEELVRYFGQLPLKENIKVHHLPMTVDLTRFENVGLKFNLEKPYIAYCGGLNNDKDGLDILLYSFQRISEEFGDINLLLAGPKEYDGDKILALLKKLRLSSKIKYLGVLERDEIPALLTNAELLVLPRPASRQSSGGFPTKLGEYLASGRPVCSTKVGEIANYLKDAENVFFAEKSNVNSFTEAMRRALTDKTKAEEIGARGKEVAVRHFSMEVRVSHLFDFIQKNEI